MDLRAYLDVLRRRGWIILVVAVVAAALTYGISLKQTKIYQATTRISAVPARPDWGLGNSAKDLLRNFVNNIQTHDMAQNAINTAKLDFSPEALLGKITVSAEPDNFLIRIDARDQDPQVATTIARTISILFVNERQQYYETQDKANRIEVKQVDSVIETTVWRPQPKLNAAAAGVLGALIGGLIVLALEWMAADILATPEMVERHLGMPVLGTTLALTQRHSPAAAGITAQPHGKGFAMPDKLVALTDPTSDAAEAYRRLRTNLNFANLDAPLQTVLVAAAGADSNKATTVANLAVSFANMGKRVILVDCDLRHPAQHALMRLDNTTGVTTALQNLTAALPLQDTEVPCLRVLTSGPSVPVPSDLIASPRMAELINRLRAEADIVLFDAPPVVLSTDAAELATQVDGVLLTVNAGHTKREDAARARDLLARVNARVVGAALINVDPRHHGG